MSRLSTIAISLLLAGAACGHGKPSMKLLGGTAHKGHPALRLRLSNPGDKARQFYVFCLDKRDRARGKLVAAAAGTTQVVVLDLGEAFGELRCGFREATAADKARARPRRPPASRPTTTPASTPASAPASNRTGAAGASGDG